MENLVNLNDRDPAMLDLLGIEHLTQTFHLQGRDLCLTAVGGRVLEPILA